MPTRPGYHRTPHAPTKTEARPSAHARGYDRAWEKLRRAHLQANPFCTFCELFATLVDHRVPIVVDPSRRLDPTNLRSACVDCHAKVTTNFRTTGVNEMPDRTPERPQELAATQELAG